MAKQSISADMIWRLLLTAIVTISILVACSYLTGCTDTQWNVKAVADPNERGDDLNARGEVGLTGKF